MIFFPRSAGSRTNSRCNERWRRREGTTLWLNHKTPCKRAGARASRHTRLRQRQQQQQQQHRSTANGTRTRSSKRCRRQVSKNKQKHWTYDVESCRTRKNRSCDFVYPLKQKRERGPPGRGGTRPTRNHSATQQCKVPLNTMMYTQYTCTQWNNITMMLYYT